MILPLTISNFLDYFATSPSSEHLEPKDQERAYRWIVGLSLVTLGIFPAVIAIFHYLLCMKSHSRTHILLTKMHDREIKPSSLDALPNPQPQESIPLVESNGYTRTPSDSMITAHNSEQVTLDEDDEIPDMWNAIHSDTEDPEVLDSPKPDEVPLLDLQLVQPIFV